MSEPMTKEFERTRGKSQQLYKQVGQLLRERISAGVYRPGERMPAVSRLVKDLEVDTQTVESALAILENEGLISREPHKRPVVSVIGKRAIMYVRWCADPLCMGVVNGMTRFLRTVGQEPVITDACQNHERFLNAITHPPKGTRGLIVMPFDTPQYVDAVRQAQASGLKVVFVDRVLDEISVSAAVSDDFSGAYEATEYLINNHHQEVFYIGDVGSPSSVRERIRGWQMAMMNHNYLDPDSFKIPLDLKEDQTSAEPNLDWLCPKRAALELFRRHKRTTYSIFAGSDGAARGIYMAAEELGLAVGKDVFVIGFGNLPFCLKLQPPLSSVKQMVEQLGYEAAHLLHQELVGEISSPVCNVVPVEMIVRSSSGPANS